MIEAKVTETNDTSMDIKILKHKLNRTIGDIYSVINSDKKFELVRPYKLTKEELLKLPLGSKIITDWKGTDRDIFIRVGEDDWCNNDCDHLKKRHINENLTLNYYGTKIIKVEKPREYSNIYDMAQEPKKMTLKEVCETLGYDIEIIKEG